MIHYLIIVICILFILYYIMCKQGLYFPSLFPQLEILTDNYEIIKKEYEQCNISYDWPEKELYSKDSEWKVIPLYAFGKWNKNVNFPKTIKILEQIPDLKTALFSKLGPKTTLKPHQGWAELSNFVLRTHLGIQVPKKGKCGIVVKKSFRQIENGKLITFDDSLMHYGLNETEEDRVVLIVDIARPWWVPFGTSKVPKSSELINMVNEILGEA